MTEMKGYADGAPCWVDMTVPDLGAAKRFYSGVLGWEFDDSQYAMAMYAGSPVAGLSEPFEGQPPPEQSNWTVYLATSDCAASEAAAVKAGGTVIVPTNAMDPWGTMAIVADPAGTVTALWQAGQHFGSARYDENGAPCWAELSTRDPAATRAFMNAVFGYGEDPMPGDMDYTALTLGSNPAFGVFGGSGRVEQGHGAWMVYFAVPDADAAAARTAELGGKVLSGPDDTPFGRMTMLTDPFGAHFAAIDLSRKLGMP